MENKHCTCREKFMSGDNKKYCQQEKTKYLCMKSEVKCHLNLVERIDACDLIGGRGSCGDISIVGYGMEGFIYR